MRTRHFPGDEEALVKVSETDDGTPLLFDPHSGNFWAKVAGHWHSRASLKEMQKLVNQTGERVPVPVHYLYPNNLPSVWYRAQVIGIAPARPHQSDRRWRVQDGSMIDPWYVMLPDGEPAAERVRSEMEACRERYDEMIEGFQREWAILLEHARAAGLTHERFADIQKECRAAKKRLKDSEEKNQ
jgi:hypothetical protein